MTDRLGGVGEGDDKQRSSGDGGPGAAMKLGGSVVRRAGHGGRHAEAVVAILASDQHEQQQVDEQNTGQQERKPLQLAVVNLVRQPRHSYVNRHYQHHYNHHHHTDTDTLLNIMQQTCTKIVQFGICKSWD